MLDQAERRNDVRVSQLGQQRMLASEQSSALARVAIGARKL